MRFLILHLAAVAALSLSNFYTAAAIEPLQQGHSNEHLASAAAEDTAPTDQLHDNRSKDHKAAKRYHRRQYRILQDENGTETVYMEADYQSTDAVLFPSFCMTIGVVVYYILSRIPILTQWLPYTAAMFLVGVVMGVGTTRLAHSDNVLNQSIQAWMDIDASTLLLVFLPGLIYKEISVGLNVHLFRASLWQIIVFAFPLVLAGAVLTALVACYIFPYNWSFNLCMTMGSILSATDTVAVAVLMNQLGASPRLKVHVSGESLLNDGSVLVFYSIFASQFLFELGVEGVGKEIGLAEGVKDFFRKSLGGVAVGIFFGIATIYLLSILNRRFTQDENIMEVAAMLGLVYVGYFVADYVWEMSGVLATVVQGIIIRFFGRAIMNDKKLLDDFWMLVDNILNTLLFTLGGIVWGSTLVAVDQTFDALEWGYLVVLYIMMTLIRGVVFFGAYPLTKRIGLGSCWQETLFQVHGGLRGAVGITLALSLNAQVSRLVATGQVDPIYEDQTRKVFGFIGGIAFITLVVNAPTCKPLLLYLKLTESSETRDKILETYRLAFRKQAIAEMVEMLSQPRFRDVNYSFIEGHISFLADLSKQEVMWAVERRKATTPPDEYVEPHLKKILPHLGDITEDAENGEAPLLLSPIAEMASEVPPFANSKIGKPEVKTTCPYLMECRALFLDILRSAYETQVSGGELVQRLFLTVALERSLDLARDQIAHGKPLTDWDYVNAIDPALVKFDRTVKGNPALFSCLECISPGIREKWKQASFRLNVERAIAFMAAHRYAQEFLKQQLSDDGNLQDLTEAAKIVLQESQAEWIRAEKSLNRRDTAFVERAVSHKFCSVLLHSSIVYIGKLVDQGLLREQEAEHWVEEVDKELEGVNNCHRAHGIRARQCSGLSETMSGRIRQVSSLADLLSSTNHANTASSRSRHDSGLSELEISANAGSRQGSNRSDVVANQSGPNAN